MDAAGGSARRGRPRFPPRRGPREHLVDPYFPSGLAAGVLRGRCDPRTAGGRRIRLLWPGGGPLRFPRGPATARPPVAPVYGRDRDFHAGRRREPVDSGPGALSECAGALLRNLPSHGIVDHLARRRGGGPGKGLAGDGGTPRDCRGPGVGRSDVGDRLVLAIRGRPPGHPGSGRAYVALRRATPLGAPRPGPRFEPLATAPLEALVCVHPPRLRVRGLRLSRRAHVPPAIRGGRTLRVGPRPRGHWTGRVRSTRGPPPIRAHLVRVIGRRGHDPGPAGGPPARKRVHDRGAAFRISPLLARAPSEHPRHRRGARAPSRPRLRLHVLERLRYRIARAGARGMAHREPCERPPVPGPRRLPRGFRDGLPRRSSPGWSVAVLSSPAPRRLGPGACRG